MKHLKTLILFFAIVALASSCKNADEIKKRAEANKPKPTAVIVKATAPTNIGEIKEISVEDFEKLNNEGKFTLVDVRTSEEYAENYIKDAVNVNFKNRAFPERLPDLQYIATGLSLAIAVI